MRYWPDVGSMLFYGDKTVANVNETPTRDYIIRELHVSRAQDVSSKNVGFHCKYVLYLGSCSLRDVVA